MCNILIITVAKVFLEVHNITSHGHGHKDVCQPSSKTATARRRTRRYVSQRHGSELYIDSRTLLVAKVVLEVYNITSHGHGHKDVCKPSSKTATARRRTRRYVSNHTKTTRRYVSQQVHNITSHGHGHKDVCQPSSKTATARRRTRRYVPQSHDSDLYIASRTLLVAKVFLEVHNITSHGHGHKDVCQPSSKTATARRRTRRYVSQRHGSELYIDSRTLLVAKVVLEVYNITSHGHGHKDVCKPSSKTATARRRTRRYVSQRRDSELYIAIGLYEQFLKWFTTPEAAWLLLNNLRAIQ
ncbi:hypothetical protein J6590_030820 [Homalodisca vitripennis]|nr:hypothetical protein J6590_030820 [Homalodisca vitripennis]